MTLSCCAPISRSVLLCWARSATRIFDLTGTAGHLQLTLFDGRLAIPVLRDKQGKLLPAATPLPSLQIDGLKPGVYELKVDGTVVLAATDKQWRRGVVIDRGPQFE